MKIQIGLEDLLTKGARILIYENVPVFLINHFWDRNMTYFYHLCFVCIYLLEVTATADHYNFVGR
jgi:hypothetical protein